MQLKIKIILIILLTGILSITQAQITNRIYTFGNSVTDGINFSGFQAIANQKGNSHIFGRHMIPGSPLFFLYNSTSSGFKEDPYGYWPTALGNYDWDCISFQPFDRDISGSEGDFTTIEKWVNYIKSKRTNVSQLQTYIYSRYPRTINNIQNPNDPSLTASLWNDLWLGNSNQGQSQERKSYFERLLTTFKGANLLPKQPAIIPAGDVMYSLNNKIVQGKLSGYTAIWQFYSDGIHMNNVGSFMLGATFFATMYKQDPRGLTVPSQYGTIPNAIRDTILQTIYEVVFTHPFSGTSLSDIIPPNGVSIVPKNSSLAFLQSLSLIPTVTPNNASNKNLSWSSNNTSVATVDNKGKVTGVGSGVATISGFTNVGGFSDFVIVTVTGLANFSSVTGILQAWDFGAKPNTALGFNATFAKDGINTLDGVSFATIGDGLRIRDDGFGDGGLMASNQDTKDLVSSIGASEYYTFTIKPNDRKLININKITFATKSEGDGHTYYLMSSIKGFNPNQILATVSGGFNRLNSFTITGHENLSQPVEFRVYVHGNASNGQYSGVGIGAVNGNDFSIEGAVITPIDTEMPSSVSGVLISQITDKGFYISWNESSDNMIVMGYNVYLNGIKLNSTLINESTFQITSLTSGLICNISITAVDFVGNESNPTTIQTITNRQPTAILNIDKTRGGVPLTVNINGLSSTDPDNVTGDFVLGYEIDFGNNSTVINANSATYTYTAPGVYTISLVVVDTRNMRSMPVTAIINVTATGSDILPPSVPNGVFLLKNQSSQAAISWGSSTDNVSLAGYNVYKDGIRLNSSLIKSTNYNITGLSEAGLYTVSVTAMDAFGNESAPSSISFTTNRRPIAFYLGNLIGNAPHTLSLDASTSYDPDVEDFITDYLWTINGTNYSGKILNITLENVGSFPSHLRVRSQNGDLSTVVSFVITVSSVPVSGISISQSNVSIPALQSIQLSVGILPSNATNKNLLWNSSNPSVVSVDASGRITGMSVGNAIVTVTSQDGNFKSLASITVSSALNTSLNIGTLAGWDFNGYTNGRSMRTTTAGTYLTGVSTNSPSLVVTIASGLGSNGNLNNALGSGEQTATSLADAITTKEYFSFTVAPQSGSQMSITQVSFAPNSQSTTRTFVLMSSVKGFTAGNEIGSVSTNFWCCSNGTFSNFSISDHNNITEQVEFRVYVYTSGTTNQYEAIHIGPGAGPDFIILGSIASPNDIQNPTTPNNLTALNIRNNSIFINWNESSDDIAVIGYNIYKDGIKLNSTPVNAINYSITGLSAGNLYNISVTAIDVVGKESSPAILNISTNNNPTALISGELKGTSPFIVTLSGIQSSDPDNGDSITEYIWDFGNEASSIGVSQNYTFVNQGIYPVSLKVKDARGGISNFVTVSITVTGENDITSPTKPGTPVGKWVSGSSNQISWGSSFDINLLQYIVILNNVSIATVDGTSYLLTDLNSSQSNIVAIIAKDLSGNLSTISDTYLIESASITVNPTSLNFTELGGNSQITITSNISWSIEGIPNWATINLDNGNLNAILDLSISENSSAESRYAQLTIAGTEFVNINQSGAEPILTINSQNLSFNSSGGNTIISISSNDSWIVTDELTWTSFSVVSGTGNGNISLSISSNNSSIQTRIGTITIMGIDNNLSRIIVITQTGANPSLTTSRNTLVFPLSITSRTININSNISWTISSVDNWISLSTTSGQGNSVLTITTISFTGIANRTSIISISGENIIRTISITQEPVFEPTSFSQILESKLIYGYPNPVRDILYFSNSSEFELRDFYGKIILKANSPIDKIDFNNYPDGIYLLIFKEQKPIKIVKN